MTDANPLEAGRDADIAADDAGQGVIDSLLAFRSSLFS